MTEKQPEKCPDEGCVRTDKTHIDLIKQLRSTPQEETWEKEFDKEFSTLYQGDVYANGGADFRPVHERLKHYIRTLLDRVRTQERERVIEQIRRYGKDWGSGASEKLFNEVLDSLLTKSNVESEPNSTT